jgi:hypothetical protein
MACLILQKKIDHIDRKKEKIHIPSESMRQWREHEAAAQAGIFSILLCFNNIFSYIL